MNTRLNWRRTLKSAKLFLLVPALLGGGAVAQTITRVSLDSFGIEGDAGSEFPAVSADGRWVAFQSYAGNLVANDSNSNLDVFIKDRQTGTSTRVSVDSLRAEANGVSREAAISADGRYVAFTSDASNLVAGDTNFFWDVFVHDCLNATTTRISVSSIGVQGNGASGKPSLSADGRYVVFQSFANNLVPGDTNSVQDVFVHDMQTGATTRVSLDTNGAQANGSSTEPSICGDGHLVAFQSTANNLVAGDTNNQSDIFLRDLLAGTTIRASLTNAQVQGNGLSSAPNLSADGRFLAFQSTASNLVAGDTNATVDVFVRNIAAATTTRVSVSSSLAQANAGSNEPVLSGDGRWVAFHSSASNLVTGDTNGSVDVFVHDRLTHATARVSLSIDGEEANQGAQYASISADGRLVAFYSYSWKLVEGDANHAQDVFLYERWGPILPPANFCFGDGTRTACPCNNDSPVNSGEGCLNSLGIGGKLSIGGAALLSADTLVLSGTGMPNGTALYFQGTAQENGGQGNVLGDGLLCAGGSIIRLGVRPNASGTSQFPDVGDPLISVKGLCTPGATRTYQIWYRNAASFCAPETFNLTNGYQVTWAP